MRSRYAAYAKGLTSYIQDTTDPEGSHFQQDRAAWTRDLVDFCTKTRFLGLTLLETPPPQHNTGTVTFRVTLKQGEKDVSFTEQSRFRNVDGRWLYTDGAFPDNDSKP
jgi:SEC-C motif-containing protein